MSKQSFNTTVLDSGLTVVTDYLPDAKTASAFWNLNSGVDRDRQGKDGCAHFFEHLLGAGHKYDPDFDTVKEFSDWGGGWGLYTGPEYTGFTVDCLVRRVPEFINIAGDAVCHSLFSHERIEIERQIIRREYFETIQDHRKTFWRNVHEDCFGAKGFSRNVIGSLDNIMSMSRDDLLDYYTNIYVSEDMVFGVSGPIPHEHVVKLVENSFKDVRRGKNPYLEAPPFIQGPQKFFEGKLEQQCINITFPLPGLNDSLNKNAGVVAGILSTPLDIHMRDSGFTYSTSIYPVKFRGGSYLSVSYETEPELAQKSLTSLQGFMSCASALVTEDRRIGLHERKEFADGLNWLSPGSRSSAIHHHIKLYDEVRSYEEIKAREILPELGVIKADLGGILQQPARVFTTGPCREVGEFDIKGDIKPVSPQPSNP